MDYRLPDLYSIYYLFYYLFYIVKKRGKHDVRQQSIYKWQ